MELERTYQRLTARKRRKVRRRIAAITENPHVIRPQGVYDDKDDIATVSGARRNVARSYLVFRGIESTRPKSVDRVPLSARSPLGRPRGQADRFTDRAARAGRDPVDFDRQYQHCHAEHA